MSVSFKMESNIKEATQAGRAALDRALNRAAIKWHAGARKATPVDTGRLRSSIAFVTPTVQRVHTTKYKDGNKTVVEEYTPPVPPDGSSVMVGTNVEYAAAVHEGIEKQAVTVPTHTRRLTHVFGRPITPMVVTVETYRMTVGPRKARRFIEEPGRALVPTFKKIVEEEYKKLGLDAPPMGNLGPTMGGEE